MAGKLHNEKETERNGGYFIARTGESFASI
jgi:hypothetical protein